jgi:hypothetical protein
MPQQPHRPRPNPPASAPTSHLDRITASPMWDPAPDDHDLQEASNEDPAIAAWLTALASLGETTMQDLEIEHRYSQAPDALRRKGIEPTPAAIDAWVHSVPRT